MDRECFCQTSEWNSFLTPACRDAQITRFVGTPQCPTRRRRTGLSKAMTAGSGLPLNETRFRKFAAARVLITTRGTDDNTNWLHSAHSYRTWGTIALHLTAARDTISARQAISQPVPKGPKHHHKVQIAVRAKFNSKPRR